MTFGWDKGESCRFPKRRGASSLLIWTATQRIVPFKNSSLTRSDGFSEIILSAPQGADQSLKYAHGAFKEEREKV